MKLKKGRYRYNGFCKNWKLVKLGNIVEINPKSFLPRTFKYVDLESVVGTELISYREEFRESAPSRAQRVAQKGDVFYQTVRPYQKNNYLFDLNENDYVFSTGYAQLRPKVDSAFLLARLQEEGFVNKVIERCSGTSYPAINSKDLSRISITIPEDFDEQSSIGSLFRTLDDLLASYKDNLANYQSLKATMLSKMFPKAGQTFPDIRLDGFEGDWKVKELGDVVEFYSGLTYKPSDVVSSGTLVLRSSNVRYGELIYKDNVFVNPDIVNCQYVKFGDIVVVVRNGSRDLIGKHALIKSEMPNTVIGAFMTGVKSDRPEFVNALLDTKVFVSEINKNLGSTINQITTGNFKRMKFSFPTKEEQQAIGAYFSNLDNLIAAHQDKISQLEILKKKLLQDMFI